MAVSNPEKYWPKIPDLSGNLVPVQLSEIGYGTGDPNDYALISSQPSTLFAGYKNSYRIFVTNGVVPISYTWEIRKFNVFDATFDPNPILSGETETGIFSWAPEDEHIGERFEIKATINSLTQANPYSTLRLEHFVFEAISNQSLALECNALGANINRTAYAGKIIAPKLVMYKYWYYITEEVYQKKEAFICPHIIAAIILFLSETYKDIFVDDLFTVLDGLIDIEEEYSKVSATWASCTCIENLMLSTSVLGDFTTWVPKDVNAPEEWSSPEHSIRTNFENYIANNDQYSIYALWRFPKLTVKFIANALRNVKNNVSVLQNIGNSENDIKLLLTHFVKYLPFDVENFNSESWADKIWGKSRIIFVQKSAFSIPNYNHTDNDLSLIIAPTDINLGLGDNKAAVATLKSDLEELGFLLATEGQPDATSPTATPNNDFYLQLEWAVREFQIYAKMKFIAKHEDIPKPSDPSQYLHQGLRRFPNLQPYSGPISGVANRETLQLIKLWKAMNWRCPVVVSVYTDSATNNTFDQLTSSVNIWMYDAMSNATPAQNGWGNYRTKVVDFSNFWNTHTGNNNPYFNDVSTPLGFSAIYGNLSGPGNNKTDCLDPNTDVMANIIPNIYPNNDTRIILMGVIRRELGPDTFLEIINCYDLAWLSFGYFHWTIGTGNSSGELPALLSYYKSHPTAIDSYKKIMTNIGLNVSHDWVINSNMWSGRNRNYLAYLSYQKEDYSWDSQFRRNTANNKNYHRTWHSFYRWRMALRNITDFRSIMLDFSRIRGRDLFTTPWGDSPNNWKNITSSGANINPTLARISSDTTNSQVFRSQRALALLLRWHVNRPSDLTNPPNNGNIYVSNIIKTIFHFARCNRIATVLTVSGNNINIGTWLSSSQQYYRTPILNTSGSVIGWNPRVAGNPPAGVDNRTKHDIVRNNLMLGPQLTTGAFSAPATWPTPASTELPDQNMENLFCQALILWLMQDSNRAGRSSLQTTMGLVYNDVTGVTRTVSFNVDDLPAQIHT